MAVSFVGVGAAAEGTASPLTVTLPASVQADDYIFLVMSVDATGGSSITSTGYTELTTETNTNATPDKVLTVLYKKAGSSESNPSVAASAGASNGFYGFAFALRGMDTTTPFDGVTPVDSTANAATDFTPTGVTTGTANAWAVSIVCSDEDNALALKGGSEQGFTDRASGASYDTITGGDNAFGLATKLIASASAVTMPTWTATVNAPTNYVGTSFSTRQGGTSVTVSASTVAASSSITDFGAETSVAVTPDATAAAASVGSPTVSGVATASPMTVAASAEVGTVAFGLGQTVEVSVIAVTVTVNQHVQQVTTASLFRPPVAYVGARVLPSSRGPERAFFRRASLLPVGQTVIKVGSTWSTVQNPSQSLLETATYVFLGGHEHVVTQPVAAELVAAGYGAYLS